MRAAPLVFACLLALAVGNTNGDGDPISRENNPEKSSNASNISLTSGVDKSIDLNPSGDVSKTSDYRQNGDVSQTSTVSQAENVHKNSEVSQNSDVNQTSDLRLNIDVNPTGGVSETSNVNQTSDVNHTIDGTKSSDYSQSSDPTLNSDVNPTVDVSQTSDSSQTADSALSSDVNPTVDVSQTSDSSQTTDSTLSSDVNPTVSVSQSSDSSQTTDSTINSDVNPTVDVSQTSDSSQTTDSTINSDVNPTVGVSQTSDSSQTTDSTINSDVNPTVSVSQSSDSSQTTDSTINSDVNPTVSVSQSSDSSQTTDSTINSDVNPTVSVSQSSDSSQTTDSTINIDVNPTVDVSQTSDSSQTTDSTINGDVNPTVGVSQTSDSSQTTDSTINSDVNPTVDISQSSDSSPTTDSTIFCDVIPTYGVSQISDVNQTSVVNRTSDVNEASDSSQSSATTLNRDEILADVISKLNQTSDVDQVGNGNKTSEVSQTIDASQSSNATQSSEVSHTGVVTQTSDVNQDTNTSNNTNISQSGGVTLASDISHLSEIHENIDPNRTSLASIHSNDRHLCTGSIISESIIMTAASCIFRSPPSNLTVRVGSTSLYAGGSKRKVIVVKIHENYTDAYPRTAHDIALLKVLPPIRWNRNVSPIKLASKEMLVKPGTNASITGWGWMNRLRDAWLRIVKCTRRNSNGHVCADLLKHFYKDKDCRIDAGGPLVANGVQVGIAPEKSKCKWSEYRDVYTNVSHYSDWITQKITELDSIRANVDMIRETHSHPWLASIQRNQTHYCTGSIISKSMILTTASCIDRYLTGKLTVRVGSPSAYAGGSVHNVTAVRSHESYYNKRDHKIDVAVVKVWPPFVFGDNVEKISLAGEAHVVSAGTNASIAGWGQTNNLRDAKMHIVKCTDVLSDGHICANHSNYFSMENDCRLDFGGPVVANGAQVGIVPPSTNCKSSKYQGVYTNVSHHRLWIEENVNELDNVPTDVGEISDIDYYPWLASIQWNHTHYSSGSIVSRRAVLTIGSFPFGDLLSKLTVRVGSPRHDDGGSVHEVISVIKNSSYESNNPSSGGNLFLLTVSPRFDFNRYVLPVNLAGTNQLFAPGSAASVAGWLWSTRLRYVNLRIVRCTNSSQFICAAPSDREICQGEIGGPLIVDRVQVGIVSHGSECALPESPGLYVKVSDYRDWIDRVLYSMGDL